MHGDVMTPFQVLTVGMDLISDHITPIAFLLAAVVTPVKDAWSIAAL